MPIHNSEFNYVYRPDTNFAPAANFELTLGNITCAKSNRFHQIWAHVGGGDSNGGIARFHHDAIIEFWDGYVDPIIGIIGRKLGEFTTRHRDNVPATWRQIEFDRTDQTAGQGYPMGPFYSWGTSSDGIRLGGKVLEIDVACNVMSYKLIGYFFSANISSFFAAISSNFPARQYHENNFQSAV